MAEEIINKVASSGLITIDLEEFYPKGERVLYDIKDNLWQGIALKEKDFRAFVKENDWSTYQDKFVAVYCTEDAIVPTWAYMLLVTALKPFAAKVVYGTLENLESVLFRESLSKVNPLDYSGARIVIKGCGDLPIAEDAYTTLTDLLLPEARSIMYGEPCSTVPIYKKPKKA